MILGRQKQIYETKTLIQELMTKSGHFNSAYR